MRKRILALVLAAETAGLPLVASRGDSIEIYCKDMSYVYGEYVICDGKQSECDNMYSMNMSQDLVTGRGVDEIYCERRGADHHFSDIP